MCMYGCVCACVPVLVIPLGWMTPWYIDRYKFITIDILAVVLCNVYCIYLNLLRVSDVYGNSGRNRTLLPMTCINIFVNENSYGIWHN